MPSAPTEPFASASEAWIWTSQALMARRDGARISAGKGKVARPCEPDDVLRCLDRLYRQRAIGLEHARVLRTYGDMARPPDPKVPAEAFDARLWAEALRRLEFALAQKGIVAPGGRPMQGGA
jgi:hypothetical protein